jgi:hypothetical protein
MSNGLRPRLRHLPSGLVASAVILVLGAMVGWLASGGTVAAGFALGVGLVAASFTASSLVIAWADAVSPPLILPVGLMTYILKFTVIGFGCAALARTGWPGLPAFGVAVIVATLTWATAQAWWTWHAKIPYVDV